jgi:hypothetical protein
VQVGSAIGRSFPLELARRAADLAMDDAELALESWWGGPG